MSIYSDLYIEKSREVKSHGKTEVQFLLHKYYLRDKRGPLFFLGITGLIYFANKGYCLGQEEEADFFQIDFLF